MTILSIILMSAAGGAGAMAALVRYVPSIAARINGGGGPRPKVPK